MRVTRFAAAAVTALAAATAGAQGRDNGRKEKWPPDEMPLPLVVRNPRDLAYKQVAEREFLVFNLLATGKLAWDASRWADAADAWETLLELPDLNADLDRVVRPLAIEARQKAGQTSSLPAERPRAAAPEPAPRPPEPRAPRTVDVTGTVTGGGATGPGGAVVQLRRADGPTPAPVPGTGYVVSQLGKQFVPHLLVVPLGATVAFRNEDAIFHNVFSLSNPNDFDLGLYRSGVSRTQTFTKPGPVQLFCNIHAQMNGWIFVADTPWYAVADGAGRFTVRGVPPGAYRVEVWHESASQPFESRVVVKPDVEPLALSIGGDRRPPAFPPDKYGKPRQVQLGY